MELPESQHVNITTRVGECLIPLHLLLKTCEPANLTSLAVEDELGGGRKGRIGQINFKGVVPLLVQV